MEVTGIRFKCRGCSRIEASRAGQWCHDCALKQNEVSRLPIELVRLIERGSYRDFKYPPRGHANKTVVADVKVLDWFLALPSEGLPTQDRPALCIATNINYTGARSKGALFRTHTGEQFSLPESAVGEVFPSMSAKMEDVPIGSWIAFLETNPCPGIHLLTGHDTVTLDGKGVLQGKQPHQDFYRKFHANDPVWVVYPAQHAQAAAPCEACAAPESEPRDRKNGTAFLCDICATQVNPDDVDTIVRSRRMLDRTGVQRIKRDTIEEILEVGGPWTIMDPLFSAPNPTGDWTWVEDEYRLHLRHEDGSRYVMAAAKQPDKALELSWQKAMLKELGELATFTRYVAPNHHAQIGTTISTDGTVSKFGYWPGANLEIGRQQEKMNLIARQEMDRCPRATPLERDANRLHQKATFCVDENGIWKDSSEALSKALIDRNFHWKSVSAAQDAKPRCPLSQVGMNTFFRVRIYGIDGEFVAIRDDETVSRWGTITCTLQHPYNGITKMRFDDDVFVIPFPETCCSCDSEFSKTNREVILGDSPNQIFTGECGDCFTIGLDRVAAARAPRSIADVAASEPKKKEVKHPWSSWATVNWEEP